jgi:hypothetical protein
MKGICNSREAYPERFILLQLSWCVVFTLIYNNWFENEITYLNFGNSHTLCKYYIWKKQQFPNTSYFTSHYLFHVTFNCTASD